MCSNIPASKNIKKEKKTVYITTLRASKNPSVKKKGEGKKKTDY